MIRARFIRESLAVLLVPAIALLPVLAQAQVIRYDAPGGTFTGGAITTPILAPAADNCASFPYSFTGDTNTGVCSSAADTMWLYAGGNSMIRVTDTYVYMPYELSAEHLSSAARTTHLYLGDGGAGILALRNSTNAQTFNWYYSYTAGSDYHRGALKTSATGIEIAAETAGSGADNLDITLTPAGTGKVVIGGTASPAATDACTQWSLVADANYLYVCTATGVWKRAALTGGY